MLTQYGESECNPHTPYVELDGRTYVCLGSYKDFPYNVGSLSLPSNSQQHEQEQDRAINDMQWLGAALLIIVVVLATQAIHRWIVGE